MGNPIAIRGLDHVVVRVRDLSRALAFYRDALGCEVERSSDVLGLYQLRAGASLIDLVPVEGPLGRAGGPPPGDGRNVDHFALQLAAFDPGAIRAWLAERGFEAGEPAPRYGAEGMGPSLYVRDPDGNVVELKGPPGPAKS